VPGNLVKGMNGRFFLPVLLWSVPDEVPNHLKILKGLPPLHPWVLCWVADNHSVLLLDHSPPDEISEAQCRAEGDVEKDDIF
jgi:hypothetical protein